MDPRLYDFKINRTETATASVKRAASTLGTAMGACVSVPPQACAPAQALPKGKARAPRDKGAGVQHVTAAAQPLPAQLAGWTSSGGLPLLPTDLQLSQEAGSLRIKSQGAPPPRPARRARAVAAPCTPECKRVPGLQRQRRRRPPRRAPRGAARPHRTSRPWEALRTAQRQDGSTRAAHPAPRRSCSLRRRWRPTVRRAAGRRRPWAPGRAPGSAPAARHLRRRRPGSGPMALQPSRRAASHGAAAGRRRQTRWARWTPPWRCAGPPPRPGLRTRPAQGWRPRNWGPHQARACGVWLPQTGRTMMCLGRNGGSRWRAGGRRACPRWCRGRAGCARARARLRRRQTGRATRCPRTCTHTR